MGENDNLLYTWNYEDVKERSPIWYILALSAAI